MLLGLMQAGTVQSKTGSLWSSLGFDSVGLDCTGPYPDRDRPDQ